MARARSGLNATDGTICVSENKSTCYTRAVPDDTFWREVGRVLKEVRERRGFKFVQHMHDEALERLGATHTPTHKILKQQEEGEIKTLIMLQQHAALLNVLVVDVFRTAMDAVAHLAISPEGARELRRFERLNAVARGAVSEYVSALVLSQPPPEATAASKTSAPDDRETKKKRR
jgi:hypothetical protein